MKVVNKVAVSLSLILILATLVFVFGESRSNTVPSAVNTRGLGIAAFAELLRQNQIPIVLERSEVIHPNVNDILIVVKDNYKFEQYFDEFSEEHELEESDIDAQPSLLEQSIERHLNKGGRVVSLLMPTSPANLAQAGSPVIWNSPGNEVSFRIQQSVDEEVSDSKELPSVTLLEQSGEPTVTLTSKHSGIVLEVSDATFLRNRFITQAENANLALWLIQQFSKPGGKVIFAEASVGNVESRNALDELGGWANTAFNQFLFVIGVIVFTLNRRFGVASRELTRSKGAKELMFAMSQTLQRAKRRDHALLILRANAIDRVRKALRLSAGLTEQEIISRMHPDTQATMAQIIRMQGHEIDSKTAREAALQLEEGIKQIEMEQKATRAPQ